MKLRIVTATRGDSPHWPEAAASIAAIGVEVDHLVVCPAERIAALQPAAPAARFVAERSRGLYPALNQGLREPGDWDAFTWLNDDDVLLPAGFASLVATLRRDARPDAAYGRVDLIDSHGALIGALPVARRGSDLPALFARGIMPLAQPGTVMRRAVWDDLQGLDESYRYAADFDLFVRAIARGCRFGHVSARVAAFRLRAGQLSKQRIEVAAETRRALAVLQNVRPATAAWWRFRLGNFGVYAGRIRRHGWVSMRDLYDRTG